MNYQNLKMLVVDDDENSLFLSCDALENFVLKSNILKCQNIKAAIELLKNNNINMAFLDIEMGNENGFDLSEYIHNNYPQIKIVFLTGHVGYAAKCFDYQPLDFLSKPINILRLEKTLKKYSDLTNSAAVNKVGISSDVGFVLVNVSDIKYIAREDNKVMVIMNDNKRYVVNHSMDYLENEFNCYHFIRIHQSYLAPLNEIVKIQSSIIGKTYQVRLMDGTILPLSRNKYATLKDNLSKRGIHFI